LHGCELGGGDVEKFFNWVIVVEEVDVDVEDVLVSGAGRVSASDVVVFYEHWGVGGGGRLEGKWALEVLSG